MSSSKHWTESVSIGEPHTLVNVSRRLSTGNNGVIWSFRNCLRGVEGWEKAMPTMAVLREAWPTVDPTVDRMCSIKKPFISCVSYGQLPKWRISKLHATGVVSHRLSPRWVSLIVSLLRDGIRRREGRCNADPNWGWSSISLSSETKGINGYTPSNSGACSVDREIRSKVNCSRWGTEAAMETTSLSLLWGEIN